MKRIVFILCALVIVLSGCVPVLAAVGEHSYYPISIEEKLEGRYDERRIIKVYQLSLSDDPANIPSEDFERQGCTWHLLDMTRKDDIGVETKPWVETVTKPSGTSDMETVLRELAAELEVTTEDGYSGTLRLDHTSVQVKVDGYGTKTRSLSATRTYPNLSDADLSLIPKSIQDNGHTLTLGDVQWSESWQTEAEGAAVRYSATASYTGSTSSTYATGYTVTASYAGEVAKTGCDVVTYTAIFGISKVSDEAKENEEKAAREAAEDGEQQEAQEQQERQDEIQQPEQVTRTAPISKRMIVLGVVVLTLATAGAVLFRRIKRS